MASTTIDTETELSAVNSILGAIGQSPVTTLNFTNPEISFIYNLLRDANVDVQNEGWHFNTEKHVTYTPNSNGKIVIGDDILRMDITDGWNKRQYDVVKRCTLNITTNARECFLYDKYDHTDDWSELNDDGIDLDITRLFSFEDLPSVFRRYVTQKACRLASTQLVANPQLTAALQQEEAFARAACMEYECNQGNPSMFGFPEDTVYHTYQPWRNLRR